MGPCPTCQEHGRESDSEDGHDHATDDPAALYIDTCVHLCPLCNHGRNIIPPLPNAAAPPMMINRETDWQEPQERTSAAKAKYDGAYVWCSKYTHASFCETQNSARSTETESLKARQAHLQQVEVRIAAQSKEDRLYEEAQAAVEAAHQAKEAHEQASLEALEAMKCSTASKRKRVETKARSAASSAASARNLGASSEASSAAYGYLKRQKLHHSVGP